MIHSEFAFLGEDVSRTWRGKAQTLSCGPEAAKKERTPQNRDTHSNAGQATLSHTL